MCEVAFSDGHLRVFSGSLYLFGQFGDGFSVLALEYLGGIHALGDKDVELAWVWSAWHDIQQ
ncbi:MAG: hypothetical protein WA794_16265 [Trebonia sp.]